MVKPDEVDRGQYDITLRGIDDRSYLAKVELGCRDWNTQQGRQTECRVRLFWSEGEIEETDWNFLKHSRKFAKS